MTKWKIYNEDAIEWAKNYQKAKFHALLTDTPYNLESITKRFGKNGSAKAQYGKDGVFQRASKGFMNQAWDTDVAFRKETWEAFSEVLHPGAFGMAFSASRNWHRMAVAIEDAGFILHPTMFFLWIQGQGFPKATNISKQMDYHDGSQNWEGHRYGLQALKPAVEPIIVFQKPYEGKPLDNIVSTGAGALNIDGGRIPLATGDEYTINTFDDGAKPWGNGAGHKYTSRKVKEDKRLGGKGTWKTDKAAKNVYEGGYEGVDIASSPLGRWPANLILDEESARRLDAQTGELGNNFRKSKANGKTSIWGSGQSSPTESMSDSGGASRFFYQVSTQLDESDPFLYQGKVSPKERNAGLQEFPEVERSYMNTHNGDPTEGETWHPVDERTGKERDRFSSKSRNPHPTLKPISLSQYLATLLLPPDGYAPRRIFVPFSGVASEMIGCGLAGWEHVVGVEFDKENGYVDIAEKRLQHWLKENK